MGYGVCVSFSVLLSVFRAWGLMAGVLVSVSGFLSCCLSLYFAGFVFFFLFLLCVSVSVSLPMSLAVVSSVCVFL